MHQILFLTHSVAFYRWHGQFNFPSREKKFNPNKSESKMTWHGILSSSPAVFYYKMKKAVSLKSSLYRIFLSGQQTSITSTRKSIIPDHFPQSHKVTPLKQAVLCWLCHLQCNQNLPTAAHGSQVPRKLYLWVADSDHFSTGYYWHPEQCHQRPMIIVCLRFSKTGRFGYWEQMSPNNLTNDEGGRKNGSKQTFPNGKQYACVCVWL